MLASNFKKMLAPILKPFSYLVNFFLPCFCIICEKEIDQGLVCNDCLNLVVYLHPPFCPHCGRPIDKKKTCGFCRHEKYLDYGRAFTLYIPPVDKMIHHLKYRGKTNLARFFGLGMAGIIKSDHHFKSIDSITPVPLFWWKRLRRTYNQAEILSKIIYQETSVPLIESLIRIKNTKTQTKLDHKKRQENVHNAFALKKGVNIEGKKVLLIDDVMTTCATIKECARILKEGGAKNVYSLVAAITP